MGKRPRPAAYRRYGGIFRRFHQYTMVRREAYIANLHLVDEVLRQPGLRGAAVVECGTWRGGMAAGLMLVGGPDRVYHFFDSFKGLPPPGSRDGREAAAWARNVGGPRYFNNCTASYEEFLSVIAMTRISYKSVEVHQGWFQETVPNTDIPPLAVLRLDADWYDATTFCLEKFWPALLPGALLVLDDYYDWEGCRKALHDFLSRNSATEAIEQSAFGGVCFIRRQPEIVP